MFHYAAFALALILVAGSAPRVEANLIARWSFDESSGTTAADGVGGFDGALQGQASFAPAGGIRGGAVELDAATGDLVNMGDHLAFTGTASFSLQAWIKTGQASGSLVVGRHVATIVAGYWLGINDTSDGPPSEAAGSFHLYQSDNPQLNSGDKDLDDGQWHQILAVRDGAAGRIRLYVDGQRVPGESSTGDLNSINATAAPFLVGGLVIGETPTGDFTGLIDEVRVWDTALSDTEAAFFFQHPDSLNPILCGDANASDTLTASDALYALRSAVGTSTCLLCLCDTNDSGSITASDALVILKKAVGQPVVPTCPQCIAGDLSGLRWELPCTNEQTPVCSCENQFAASASLLGESGAHYDVTLRFRGVIEQKSYIGGTQDGYFLIGGTPAADGYNIYRLDVSSPAATYYLNAGASFIARCWELDQTETIPIDAGATVTLTGNAIDSLEIANSDGTEPIVPADVPPAPQAYNGQFIQMDVISIVEQK